MINWNNILHRIKIFAEAFVVNILFTLALVIMAIPFIIFCITGNPLWVIGFLFSIPAGSALITAMIKN